jgi:hypothetical protein
VLAIHWASHLSASPENGGAKPLFVHPGLPG